MLICLYSVVACIQSKYLHDKRLHLHVLKAKVLKITFFAFFCVKENEDDFINLIKQFDSERDLIF